MHVVLMALGLVISVAGIVLIGFGIPINAAALGNTLIIAGTIAIVGSLGLIGLASAIRQLRLIAQALEARPLPRALGPEPADSGPRMDAPFIAPASVPEAVLESDIERAIESEIARAHGKTRERSPAPERVEEEPAETAAAEAPPDEPSPVHPPVAPEPVAKKNFDAVWAGETRPEEPHESIHGVETTSEPAPSEAPSKAAPAATTEEVRIFRSGVIDGMAYTLYTDGSIEAELAQGTVKFSSIDELRAYLAARE